VEFGQSDDPEPNRPCASFGEAYARATDASKPNPLNPPNTHQYSSAASRTSNQYISIYGTTEQTAEKLTLEGHGFSRAAIMIENSQALEPLRYAFHGSSARSAGKKRTSAAKAAWGLTYLWHG
jgi:hypothetical protein